MSQSDDRIVAPVHGAAGQDFSSHPPAPSDGPAYLAYQTRMQAERILASMDEKLHGPGRARRAAADYDILDY